jgi:hypothetical protein
MSAANLLLTFEVVGVEIAFLRLATVTGTGIQYSKSSSDSP